MGSRCQACFAKRSGRGGQFGSLSPSLVCGVRRVAVRVGRGCASVWVGCGGGFCVARCAGVDRGGGVSSAVARACVFGLRCRGVGGSIWFWGGFWGGTGHRFSRGLGVRGAGGAAAPNPPSRAGPQPPARVGRPFLGLSARRVVFFARGHGAQSPHLCSLRACGGLSSKAWGGRLLARCSRGPSRASLPGGGVGFSAFSSRFRSCHPRAGGFGGGGCRIIRGASSPRCVGRVVVCGRSLGSRAVGLGSCLLVFWHRKPRTKFGRKSSE